MKMKKRYWACVLILPVLLSGCSNRCQKCPLPKSEEYSQKIVTVPETGTVLRGYEVNDVRYEETLRAYPVGRYSEPNHPEIMHEKHVIYRQETSPRWNLNPPYANTIQMVPSGPVTEVVDYAKAPTEGISNLKCPYGCMDQGQCSHLKKECACKEVIIKENVMECPVSNKKDSSLDDDDDEDGFHDGWYRNNLNNHANTSPIANPLNQSDSPSHSNGSNKDQNASESNENGTSHDAPDNSSNDESWIEKCDESKYKKVSSVDEHEEHSQALMNQLKTQQSVMDALMAQNEAMMKELDFVRERVQCAMEIVEDTVQENREHVKVQQNESIAFNQEAQFNQKLASQKLAMETLENQNNALKTEIAHLKQATPIASFEEKRLREQVNVQNATVGSLINQNEALKHEIAGLRMRLNDLNKQVVLTASGQIHEDEYGFEDFSTDPRIKVNRKSISAFAVNSDQDEKFGEGFHELSDMEITEERVLTADLDD